jgi:hypothetical protein
LFGNFRNKSNSLGKVVTSPFSILVKVFDGKVTYLQFFEDSYATAASFRKDGSWIVRTEPGTEPFQVRRQTGPGLTLSITVSNNWIERPRSVGGRAAVRPRGVHYRVLPGGTPRGFPVRHTGIAVSCPGGPSGPRWPGW